MIELKQNGHSVWTSNKVEAEKFSVNHTWIMKQVRRGWEWVEEEEGMACSNKSRGSLGQDGRRMDGGRENGLEWMKVRKRRWRRRRKKAGVIEARPHQRCGLVKRKGAAVAGRKRWAETRADGGIGFVTCFLFSSHSHFSLQCPLHYLFFSFLFPRVFTVFQSLL